MCSIPYSLLTKNDSDILSQSVIQEHQNFCKLFYKAQSSYERKMEEDKKSFSPEKSPVQQSQLKIWNWFENLSLEQKIKICTIKNKWLVKIIIQLYFIYVIDNKNTFYPTKDMNILFTNQKNYQNLGGFLCKNIHIIQNYNDKKNYNGYNEDDYCKLYFNLKESNFSQIKKDNDSENLELEKKLLDNIILLSMDDDSLDTISINLDLLKDIKYFKKILNYFSEKKFLKDWLIPFNQNNYYNFTYPGWMHNNNKLTLCKIISGIFEQQILISYEFFFYSKKIYNYPGINTIFEIYKENNNLENFLKENYSYEREENKEQKKENIITLDIVTEIIARIKNDLKYKKKFDNFKKMCDQLYNDYYKSQFYNGNKILSEAADSVFKELNIEMKKEKGKEINLLLNKITFMKLEDVKNYREYIYIFLRKYYIDLRNKNIINELLNENDNKNGRKKKKKRKNKNKSNNPLNIIENVDILNNSKIKEKYLINNNIKYENNSSSSSSKEKNKKDNKNDDTYLDIKQFNENENENKSNNLNCITDIGEISKKEQKVKHKNFFLFPINNKKKKDKIKISKEILDNNNKEKEKSKEKLISEKETLISVENEKEKKINEENNINNLNNKNEELKIDNKEKSKEKEDSKKKMKNKKKTKKEKENKNFSNEIINEKEEENSNKKLELSKISAISIQMLNETKSKKNISNNEMAIEKQNQIEINKLNTLPETTTSFSYTPKNKNENSINEAPVNMTINIINNQYIYQQYPFINNCSFIQFAYYYHIPSELFFNLLTKEMNYYNNFTCKNIDYLNKIRGKYLIRIEELIREGLKEKYNIKFGHYGSYFTNLSIEGSDLDILVFYKPNNPNFNFLHDIIDLLNENENKFESILPILSASVPLIKLQINISKEIDNKIIQFLPYFENKDITHLKFDLTFTSDENEYQRSIQIVSYINKNMIEFPDIKPLLLLVKRYFRSMKMNKSFTGGLSSFSLFLLILTFLKNNKSTLSCLPISLGKSLYSILEKYSFFDYKNYGINVEGPEFYFSLNDDSNNNINSINTINNFKNKKDEINVLDPFTKLNIAKSSFQVDEIKNTFNKALFFLKFEAWKFDTNNFQNFNNGNFNENYTYLGDFKDNDYIIIKKLFSIK